MRWTSCTAFSASCDAGRSTGIHSLPKNPLLPVSLAPRMTTDTPDLLVGVMPRRALAPTSIWMP